MFILRNTGITYGRLALIPRLRSTAHRKDLCLFQFVGIQSTDGTAHGSNRSDGTPTIGFA